MDARPDLLCPNYCRAIDILGKRWTCLILSVLMDGPRRFSELEQAVSGIGGRMLCERLRDLTEHGIVETSSIDGSPSRVRYGLSPKGRELRSVVREIERWANRWEPEGGRETLAKPA